MANAPYQQQYAECQKTLQLCQLYVLNMTSPIAAILVFPEISLFHISVPTVVLHDVSHCFAVRLVAEQPGSIVTSSGTRIEVSEDLSYLSHVDLLVIPSWHDPYQPPSAQLVTAIQTLYQRQIPIISLCLGAYLLAACALLDNKRATTHWAYAADFRSRFPNVILDEAVLYIDEHNLITSAGTAAGLDCCLHLIRKLHGNQFANQVARQLVIAPHRQGDQAQFLTQPLPKITQTNRLEPVLNWMRENPAQTYTVEMAADKANMSRRHFSRQFLLTTGKTFSQWLIDTRLAYSQQLLESSNLGLDHIAQQAGFANPATMRKYFKLKFSLTPSQWRARFGVKMGR